MPTKPTRLTPLMLAVRRRSLPLVRLLLQHGANANAQDAGGRTALMHSVPSGAWRPGDAAAALPIAQALLAAGADPNLRDDFGDTALMPAAQFGAMEMTKLLLEHGADVRVKNRLGRTAWMTAADFRHVRLTQLLLSRDPSPDVRSMAGATALRTAARAVRAAEVRRLIAEGIDVNAPDGSGSSALMLAASFGNSPADPDTVRPFKLDPYWGAEEIRLGRQAWLRDKKSHEDARATTRRMRHDTLLVLLDPAAGLRVEGERQAAPLFRAALTDDRAAARLLSGGADPNARDIAGFTALMAATALGHRETVAALLQHGATVNAWDRTGRTALMWAAEAGEAAIAKLLAEHGALLETRSSDERMYQSMTPLLVSIWYGHPATAEVLIRAGADVRATDGTGKPALEWAKLRDDHETAERLRLAGAVN